MTECFIGRQPIMDGAHRVYAYELLYRSSLENAIGEVDRTVATSRVVMNAFVDIGLEKVVGQHRAFIHVSEEFLSSPDLMCFPPERVALQITDPIDVTPGLVGTVNRLRQDGYNLVLNGYRSDQPIADLLPYADVVKLDALDHDDDALRAELTHLLPRQLLLVAKRVETMDRRNDLLAMGFHAFQGHFLARPEIVTGTRLPANQLAILQLMSRISDPELETRELERLISIDPSLSLRVLRFVNSPLSGLSRRVESIHQAVVLVGRVIIRNWVMLLAMASLDSVIPELVKSALIRARLCEQLAVEAKLPGRDSFFTCGLFSLVDAIMARPMYEILGSLPFTAEVRAALEEHAGLRGDAIVCAEQLEAGAPDGASFLDIDSARLAQLYLEAIVWADQATLAVS